MSQSSANALKQHYCAPWQFLVTEDEVKLATGGGVMKTTTMETMKRWKKMKRQQRV